MVVSIVFLILKLLNNNDDNLVAIEYAKIVLNSVSQGLLGMLLVSNMLELVCAQAPYNMRSRIVWWMYDVGDVLMSYYWQLYS